MIENAWDRNRYIIKSGDLRVDSDVTFLSRGGRLLSSMRQDDAGDEGDDGDGHCGSGCYKCFLFHNTSFFKKTTNYTNDANSYRIVD